MCGICGEIALHGSEHPDISTVQRMMSVLNQRGPDAAGLLSQQNFVFGHRRLKIIDLSEHAQQPMHDPDLGLSLTFNGCIYNYRELRAELEAKGYRFFSQGDSEVILKAYHAWGADCVRHFNGMFAFVLQERDTRRIVMARDRFGIKPLYYAPVRGLLRFASSLPAILATADIDTNIDPVALHHYLHWHAVVPAPLTLFKGVRKLPPATLRIIEADGKAEDHLYWQQSMQPQPGDADKTETEWRDELLAVLRRAVSRRAVADVPVGVLLSGGLDSSLLVGLLAEQNQSGLNTFSVGFESVAGEEGDEFKYSNIIASHYGTRHHQIRVPSDELLDQLPLAIEAMSEPMVSYDNIGFYLLSQRVSQELKVVQCGQGADEVFAGYHWYPPMAASEHAVDDYCRTFFDVDESEYAQAVAPEFIGDNYSRQFVEAHFSALKGTSSLNKALHIDSHVMLVDDPVKRVDNMTMAWGLEARVPFLDHELVEFAGRIPGELKLRDGGKYILKEAARQVVPAAVIDRPKGYFPVPALKYIEGPFLEFVRHYLDSDRCRQRGLFQRDYIDRLLADPKSYLTPLRGSKLWQLALLESWLQIQGV